MKVVYRKGLKKANLENVKSYINAISDLKNLIITV